MKKILFVFLCLCLTVQIWSEKKALSFTDVFAAGRLSSPTMSPDGKWIVFEVKTPDIDRNTFQSDLYAADAEGMTRKKLTDSKGDNYNPHFLKSGLLTFISTRGNDPQIYALNLKTPAEIKPITSIPGGVSDFIWLPDQKNIAFAKDIDPRAKSFADAAAMGKKAEDSKVKAKVLTALLFRVWDSWRDGKRNHVFQHRPGSNDFIDLTPGDFDTPPLDLGGAQDYLFSNDGAWFAYVKNTDPVVAVSTNNDIWLRNLSNGKEENISRENQGNDANPVFSPKNNYLAYLSMKRPGFEADKKDIILYNLKTAAKQNLTAAFPNTIASFVFGADEKTIYFIASESIYEPIFKLHITSKKIAKIVPEVNASSLSITADGKSLIYLVQNVTMPQEIFKFDLRRRQQTQLTHFNREIFKDVQMNRAEIFRFKGAKDEMVEGFLIKPPFFSPDKKYPLVLLVHGGPQNAWTDDFHYRWNHSLFASPGYVVAAINFHGSPGYGQTFTDSISGDWGGAPFVDLVKGQQYLVETFPFIDKDKIVAAGASYGGFMINWIAGHSDEFKYPFRCLVSHDGIFDARNMYYETEELWFEEWDYRGTPWTSDLFEKWNPANYVTNFKIPMLVIHGEKDFRVPVSQGLMLFTALQRRGVKSKMLYFPDENHFVLKPQNARLWWQTVFAWFAENIADKYAD
jgi:dipeptidyl aminopeptidase/acylaminoacyl peptidase